MSERGPAASAAVFDVAIVGAGIAGLTAAASLAERARARDVPLRLTLFEASPRAGGVVRTERVDGCLLEGGPDSGHDARTPARLALAVVPAVDRRPR